MASVTFGEGWHNYHHSFPNDYRGADFGQRDNTTTNFIEFLARVGLAYNLKTVPESVVKAKILKAGDGSHHFHSMEEQAYPSEELAASKSPDLL